MKSNLDHTGLTDKEFITQLENFSLSPALFSHEAHLRLAWINIKSRGLKSALETTQRQIVNFVNHLGAHGKYNKTLTIVSVLIINQKITYSNANSFGRFINENPDLKTNFRELLQKHYSPEILKSEKAKTDFVEPNLLPFEMK